VDRDDEQGEVVERQRERAGRPADDTGVIGSEAQEPGPGRDTALTDPDPVAGSAAQPRETVAMSDGDPARTRLGAHEVGAEPIGGPVDVPEQRTGDTGVIGSEAREPGPGRDTALTDPDPVAASAAQPRETVAMSDVDPARTRLGAHEEDAEPIGATAPELVADESPPRERDEDEPPRERDDDEPPPLV
jgi:hypothetical protein